MLISRLLYFSFVFCFLFLAILFVYSPVYENSFDYNLTAVV